MSELSDAIFNFAINTGRLYQVQCTMARKRVSAIAWAAHAVYACHLYVREFPEESSNLGAPHPADLLEAAANLETYYRTHIEERDRADFLPIRASAEA